MFPRNLQHNNFKCLFAVHCALWYHLCNLINVKNTHGGVLILVKLQAKAWKFTKINTPPWVFFTFFKLYKCYQIAQRTTNRYFRKKAQSCLMLSCIYLKSHSGKIVQMQSLIWSVFSRMRTEYKDSIRKSPFSAQIRENTDLKKTPFLDIFYAVSSIEHLWKTDGPWNVWKTPFLVKPYFVKWFLQYLGK